MTRGSYCFWSAVRKVAGFLSTISIMSGFIGAFAFLLCYKNALPSVVAIWQMEAGVFLGVAVLFKFIEFLITLGLDYFGEAYRFYYNDLVPNLSSQQFLSLERFAKTLTRKERIHFFHTLYLLGKPLDMALSVYQNVWFEKDGVVVFDKKYRYQIETNCKGIVTGVKMLTSVSKIADYDNVIEKLEKYTVRGDV